MMSALATILSAPLHLPQQIHVACKDRLARRRRNAKSATFTVRNMQKKEKCDWCVRAWGSEVGGCLSVFECVCVCVACRGGGVGRRPSGPLNEALTNADAKAVG